MSDPWGVYGDMKRGAIAFGCGFAGGVVAVVAALAAAKWYLASRVW